MGVHVIAPLEELARNPFPHAVAMVPLRDAVAAGSNGGLHLPEGVGRMVVLIDGTESDEEVDALKVRLNACEQPCDAQACRCGEAWCCSCTMCGSLSLLTRKLPQDCTA